MQMTCILLLSSHTHAAIIAAPAVSAPAWYADDEEKQAKMFTAKAAGYGSFLILVYFLLAAMVCLCTMRNKKVGLYEWAVY